MAVRGVDRVLQLMGERDEFGLWLFSGAGTREAIPIGPRHQATPAELDQVMPAGGTPLFQAIVDGVAGVGPSDGDRVNALVVLTDGEDTTSELTSSQLNDAVRGKGVRVFVIAVGGTSCTSGVLRDLALSTGGACADTDVESVDGKLTGLFRVLWGVG